MFQRILGATLAVLLLAACSTEHPRRNPTGEMLPRMSGENLAEEEVVLPAAVAGEPALLLVGFEQDTQFDLDRWLIGLDMAGVEVEKLEVPTIPGMMPGLFAGRIDSGMRQGIPREDWPAVVTLYGDAAERMAAFVGNEPPLPGRILLLDANGVVAWFHDEGFSVGALNALRGALAGHEQQSADGGP